MTETLNGTRRVIRRVNDTYVRQRDPDSERQEYRLSNTKRAYTNFDTIPLEWLSENYIKRFGLRNWTWKVIMKGIIKENQKVIYEIGR